VIFSKKTTFSESGSNVSENRKNFKNPFSIKKATVKSTIFEKFVRKVRFLGKLKKLEKNTKKHQKATVKSDK